MTEREEGGGDLHIVWVGVSQYRLPHIHMLKLPRSSLYGPTTNAESYTLVPGVEGVPSFVWIDSTERA